MNVPIKLLTLLLFSIAFSGCSFLPLPLIYLNHGKTVYDAGGFFMDYPNSNDVALSSITGKHCRVINVFVGEDVCREKSATEKMQEYVDTLKEVN